MITDLTLVSFVFHVRSRHACFFQSMCRIWVSIRVLDLMKGFDVQIFMCDLRRKAASRLRRESGLLSFFVCLVALVLRSEYVTGTDVARCAKHYKNTSRPHLRTTRLRHNGKKTTDMDSSSSRLRSRGGNRRARSYRFGVCVCTYRTTWTGRKVGCPVPASSPARRTFIAGRELAV